MLRVSFDFSSNIICTGNMHPHSRPIVEMQLMVRHDVLVIDVKLMRKAVCASSNEESHGWYSALPAYKRCIDSRIEELRGRGMEYELNVIYSDRGPSCYWTSGFKNYAIEICVGKEINLN